MSSNIAYSIRTANTSSNGWGLQEEVTHTLDQAMGLAVAYVPAQRKDSMSSEVAFAIQAGAVRENPESGPDGVGIREDNTAYTLEARAEVQAVAFVQNSRDEVRLMGGDGQVIGALSAEPGAKQQCYVAFTCKDHGADAGEIAPTLRGMGHDTSHANAGGQIAVAFNLRGREGGAMPEVSDVASMRAASGGSSRSYVAMSFTERGREGGRQLDAIEEVAYCLTNPGAGGRSQERNVMTPTMAVRRLTPRECERLQGFPDDYTLIPMPAPKASKKKLDWDYIKYLFRGGRLTQEQCQSASADGPRYKALGNSFAVPVVRWIGERIQTASEQSAIGKA